MAILEQVIFRTNASKKAGYGHIMRCLALAQYLVKNDIECVLFTTNPKNHTIEEWNSYGISVLDIGDKKCSDELSFMMDAISVSPKKCIYIVDGYDFDSQYFKLARESGFKVAVIDDLADREIEADWIINQNAGAECNFKYNANDDAKLLLGDQFVILRQEFLNNKASGGDGILITLGGADEYNFGLNAFKYFSEHKLDVNVHLVHAGNSKSFQEAETLSKKHPNLFVSKKGSILSLMLKADIAFCAGGVTSLEFAYLGVPSVITIIADNQRPGAISLEKNGAAIIGDDIKSSVEKTIKLMKDKLRRQKMSRAAHALVDGKGINRIYDAFQTAFNLH